MLKFGKMCQVCGNLQDAQFISDGCTPQLPEV